VTVPDRVFASNDRFSVRAASSQLPAAPARGVAVLACMDARIDVLRVLGLRAGDAHVVRNAGGRASDDAIRSLILSSLLFQTREFVVMHHTRCGMQTSGEKLHLRLRTAYPDTVGDEIDFLPFADLDQSVRDDVRRIERSSYIDADSLVTGCVYDVDSGRLRQVSG
jgi:carbonic anhydrase